jgi:adenylate kinase family enzyme
VPQALLGQRTFVVVNGPPGSGKTTLGRALASELSLPFMSKDDIKEALMGVWEVPNVETSRELGRAAIAAMLAVARSSSIGAVLEANFRRELAQEELRQLGAPVLEVFCRCPRDLSLARYRQRSSLRHPGHLDADRSDDDLWNVQTANPIGAGWPVIEVDTSEPVDMASLVGTLYSARP